MSSQRVRTGIVLNLAVVICMGIGYHPAKAQDLNEFIAPRAEAGFFGGASWPRLQQTAAPATAWYQEGGLAGVRATYNMSRFLSLEGTFSGGVNNVHVPVTGSSATKPLSSTTYEGFVGLLAHLVGPTHHLRPFIKAGPGGYWFRPRNAEQFTPEAQMKFQPAMVTGAGFKAYISRNFGFRVDGDASYMSQPHFHLPGGAFPGVAFIPAGGNLWHFQATAGIFLGWGRVEHAAIASVPPSPPPPPPPAAVLDVESAGARTVDLGCPGETRAPISLAVQAKANLPGHVPSYRWSVNGNQAGENASNFQFAAPAEPGQYSVGVTVSDSLAEGTAGAPAPPVTRELLVATVRPYQAPTLSVAATPQQINAGDHAALTLTPQGGACFGKLTYACKSGEGTVTGTPPNQFDSSGVTFDPDRSRAQSKTITIACTATDSNGGTASAEVPVMVNQAAELVTKRIDDIVFPAGSSRVNNCGKRLLLDEVYLQLSQHPDWDLVLVGHIASNERTPHLDQERVLNVVATMTAGADTCPALELSRIRVAFAGSGQKSEARPAFCGASTRVRHAERPGQMVSGDDPNAAMRRVEVYLVQKGAPLPGAAENYQVITQGQVAPRGCPR